MPQLSFRLLSSALAFSLLLGTAAAASSRDQEESFVLRLQQVERDVGRALSSGNPSRIRTDMAMAQGPLTEIRGRSKVMANRPDCVAAATALFNLTNDFAEGHPTEAANRDARRFLDVMPRCEEKVGLKQRRFIAE